MLSLAKNLGADCELLTHTDEQLLTRVVALVSLGLLGQVTAQPSEVAVHSLAVDFYHLNSCCCWIFSVLLNASNHLTIDNQNRLIRLCNPRLKGANILKQ